MDYVKIGKIVNTFGVKGELKLENYSDFAEDRYQKGSLIYVGPSYIPETVKSFHFHKNVLQIVLEGKEDINLVERYKGLEVFKNKADIPPLKKGEYYFSDLIHLDVYAENEKIGTVIQMEEGTRCNYLRVKLLSGKESLIPFIPTFIQEVSLDLKTITIIPMEGLL